MHFIISVKLYYQKFVLLSFIIVVFSIYLSMANLQMERPHVALDKALAFEANVVEMAEEHPQEQVVTAQHFIWWILTEYP